MPAPRRFMTLLAACALAAPAQAAAAGGTGGVAAPTGDEPLLATPHVMVAGTVTFSGRFHAADAGRTVTVERYDAATATWAPITTAAVGAAGRWSAPWRADVPGRHRARALLAGPSAPEALTTFTAAAPFETGLTVYRPAVASWYGPGFYGRRTACGVKMTRRLLGVAHKKLPCGTEVALHYQGASITVPVVDRGPYVKGRTWDLTAAAAKALGFAATDRLGAVTLD